MLLYGHDGLRFLCGSEHGFFIERLQAIHVKHAHKDVRRCKRCCRLLRLNDKFTASDDRAVPTVRHRHSLAQREVRQLAFVDVLDGVPPDADVGRIGIGNQLLHERPRQVLIARQVDAQPRNRPHRRDIIRRVMRHAERTVAHAPRDADELDVRVRIGDIDLRLFHAARRQERRGRHSEGTFAASGKTRTDADEILLGDAHLDELLLAFRRIGAESCRTARIAAEYDDVPVLFRGLNEEIRDDLLACLTHSRLLLSSSSFNASTSSASDGTL